MYECIYPFKGYSRGQTITEDQYNNISTSYKGYFRKIEGKSELPEIESDLPIQASLFGLDDLPNTDIPDVNPDTNDFDFGDGDSGGGGASDDY